MISESFEPDQIVLSLTFEKTSAKSISVRQEATVIEYLTDHAEAKAKDIASLLNVSDSRARAVLARLVKQEIVVAEGSNKTRVYKLKS